VVQKARQKHWINSRFQQATLAFAIVAAQASDVRRSAMPHGSAAARALPETEAISRKPASRPSPNTKATFF
jgi:hypothetical protein